MKNSIQFLRTLILVFVALAIARVASANTELWVGIPDVSATTNWSANANWSLISGGGNPGYTNNDLLFGNGGTVGIDNTINSVVDTSDTAASLIFTNQSSLFHTVLIPTGVTLTISNALTVGSTPALDANNTKANFTGGGTLLQRGNVTVRNNASTSGSTSLATLDLSGLSFFVCSNTGTLNVAGVASETRSAGALLLAGVSNNITVTTLNLQTTGGNGGNQGGANLRLGPGTNIINAGTINIVAGKAVGGTVNFQGGTGGVRIRGSNGNADDSSRATIVIANRNNTGSGTINGTIDFTGGHPADVKASTITIGQSGTNPTSAGQGCNGTLRFDAGIVDATAINIAINTVANVSSTTGTLTVGGGTLVVGNISLVNQTAGGATGNLNINGLVNCSGNITKTTLAGTGNITITGGTLTLASGKTVGTPAMPIDNLNLTTATLNVAVLNNLTNFCVSVLNLADAANTVNVSALPSVGGFPTQFPLVSYTFLSAGLDLNLGPLPGGYTGYISNDLAGTMWLVVTNGPFVAKTDQWGGGINNLWDTSTLNWTNAGIAVNYNEGDFVIFDDAAQSSTVNLTAQRQPTSLTVSNNVLNYTFTGAGRIGGTLTLVKNGSAPLILSETGGDNFTGGIVVSNGTVILDNPDSSISGGLTVVSGATAQIGNNTGNGILPSGGVVIDGTLVFKRSNELIVSNVISGAGNLIKSGSGRLALSGTQAYTGNTIVTNGTLALTGAVSIVSSPEIAVSGATLDLTGANGPQTLVALNTTNANLSLAVPNTQTPLNVSALNMGGSANTINLSSLPPTPTYPVTVTLIQSASPVVGFNATLGTLPPGSPSYAGSLSLSGDQLSVKLTLTAGPVGVRPTVFWTGADVPNLNTNWSDGANWLLAGAPTAVDNVVFNSTATAFASALTTAGGGTSALDPANFNNIVDANFTIASLTYSNIGSTYHNTHLANGRTLGMTNTFAVGAFDSGTAQLEFVTISGAAAVSVNNTNANVQVWVGNQNAGGSQATLDMSALDQFTATVGRLTVGASAINNAVNRPSGILYLAKTNTINAAFQTTTIEAGTTTGNAGIVVADCNQNAGPTSYLYLGQVNTISADTVAIARQKTMGNLLFNPTYANVAPYPTLTLQGYSSSRVSVFDVASGAGNTGTTTGTGTADLSGGIVNAMVDTLNVGRASSPASGTSGGTITGVLTFDAGTINANNLNVGVQPSGVHTSKVGIGTVNVGTNATIGQAGHLIVNGNLLLASTAGGTGGASTSGTLNINGGIVEANRILVGTNGGTSTITLNSGVLAISTSAGSPATPLTVVNLNGGTLQLGADGASGDASLVATTINMGGTTTLNVGSIINVISPTTLPLISYTGADPFAALSLGTLPPGFSGTLVDDSGNSLISLMLTTVPAPPPLITSVYLDSGNKLVMSGTNGTAGSNYFVLTATNVALPRTNWTRISTNQFGPGGAFAVTNTINANEPRRFYLLQLP